MATLFYVTPTGSDSNIGTTIGASFLTIDRAINASTSSNSWDATTIKVYPSASSAATYYEELHTAGWPGPLRQGVTLEAITGKGTVYLDVHGKAYGWRAYSKNTIKNFYITGSNGTTSNNTFDVYQASSTPIRIENCTFDNCTPSNKTTVILGQDASYTAGDSWIKRCTFKNLNCQKAIDGPLKGVVEIESILIYDSTFDISAISARGNYTVATGADIAPAAANMGTVLENVTVDGCTSAREMIALLQRAFARNCIVSNCNVTSADYKLFYSENTSSYVFPDNKSFFNCIAYNNEGTAGNLFYPHQQTSSCFVDQDPGYLDRSDKDFSLSNVVNGSIAVNAGTSLVSASFDINSASYTEFTSPHPIGCFQNPYIPPELRIDMKGSLWASAGGTIFVH